MDAPGPSLTDRQKSEDERAPAISPHDETRSFRRGWAAMAHARQSVALYLAVGPARLAAAGAGVAGAARRRQARYHRGAVHLEIRHRRPRTSAGRGRQFLDRMGDRGAVADDGGLWRY